MEENKNIEPEQPTENIPQGNISSEKNILFDTEATITKKELNTDMDVHHHTHSSHGKKSWKSYFWEFLMLFLAVFCDFLAAYQL